MDVTFRVGWFQKGTVSSDVILNGGEAAVRDRMRVETFRDVDGNAPAACCVVNLSTSSALLGCRTVLRAGFASLRMTSSRYNLIVITIF